MFDALTVTDEETTRDATGTAEIHLRGQVRPGMSTGPLNCSVSAVSRSAVLLALWVLMGCMAAVPPDGGAGAQGGAWPEFAGAWFTVAYPPGFRPEPVLAAPDGSGWDSVRFRAPDGLGAFYVLSPQWRRTDPAIAFDPATEQVIAKQHRTGQGTVHSEREIVARDGSYLRTIETVESADGTVSWTFQLTSRDAMARETLLPAYRRFKASLQQFAD
ncbi:MAG: hypothetical protein KDH20_05225 [Rhodocyclaceae bacterium]|nr:hypothetical protein [Rhodocyclaceae bacterium]